mgnify:CR=1 FL=1
MFKYSYESPFGLLTLAEENNKLTNCNFGNSPKLPQNAEIKETKLIKEAWLQLQQYFNGCRKTFELPLAPQGTTFQQAAWQALLTIPYGQTASYKDMAVKISNPKACRAIGMANNKNPIGIIIPCHRVIGSNGKLVGYAGGLDIKQKLLELEKFHSL